MVELQPVDAVEVTLVVDNFVDILMAGAEGARRFPLAYDHFDQDQLAARTGRRLPLLIHPEAWRERKVTFPTGAELRLPRPAGPTWRPRAWRWWRSAARPCCSTVTC